MLRRSLVALLTVGALVAPLGVAQATTDSNPFAGESFFADPYSNAAQEAAADPANAEIWNRIADHAQADWFGDWYSTSQVQQKAADRVAAISGAGGLPVLVVYAIPQRDCGGYSSGGTNTPEDYQDWVDQFASGLGSAKVAVVLEPDALAMLDCLSATDRETRLSLLSWAVDRLGAQGNVSVYLDAGHSSWHAASTMAQRLSDAGVDRARGFSLNVSNFNWSADEVAYGTAVSDRIGGKTFVVDTSRNGLGPSTDPNDPEPWCNPSGRGLGTPATAQTDHARVDAYFWIKRPGESDGTCKGGPPAGSWWKDYAYGLADRAPWAPEPPPSPCASDGTHVSQFRDVPSDNVHSGSIDCAAAHGLVRGITDDLFAPERPVNRAQMASFVVRLLDVLDAPPPADQTTSFSDTAGSPHAAAIEHLADLGMVAGDGEGRYHPDAEVTRAQIATMLVAAYEYAVGEELVEGDTRFSDVETSPHRDNIHKAAAAGFASGVGDGRYDPAGAARRDQMATLLVGVHASATEPR